MSAIPFADLVNRNDVGMIQRRSRSCLLLESPQAVLIFRELRRQEFERYFAIKRRILRQVNVAHSARTKCPKDPVATESLSDKLASVILRNPLGRHTGTNVVELAVRLAIGRK